MMWYTVSGSHCSLGDHGIQNVTDTCCCTQELPASESSHWSDALRVDYTFTPPITIPQPFCQCQCCVPGNPNTMRLHEQVRTLLKNVLPPPSREKDGGIITIPTTFTPNRQPSYVPYHAKSGKG